MAKDHLIALEETLLFADAKKPFNTDQMKRIAGLILKNTKGKVNTPLGSFDPSNGDLRLLNVWTKSSSFPNFTKVPQLFNQLVNEIIERTEHLRGFKEINDFAFDAHYKLVNIHPWLDGNGRMSRLLMNYIQHYHKEPLSIVNCGDVELYIEAIQSSRSNESNEPFKAFMYNQYEKHLISEIERLTKKI